MAHPIKKIAKVRAAYVYDALNLEGVARKCDVPLNTIRHWKDAAKDNGDDWDKARAAARLVRARRGSRHRRRAGGFHAAVSKHHGRRQKQPEHSTDLVTLLDKAEVLSRISDAYSKTMNVITKGNPKLDKLSFATSILRDLPLDGAQLQPFGWITHVHKAKSGYLARAGLHRVLAWPFLFKNYSVRDLAAFLEIYGLPLRLGTYPSGSSDEEKATLLRAVIQIGHDAAGIIPAGMLISFMEAAKGSHDPFQAMMDLCERTQSKAILGGTLTTQADGKSSTNALGNVHNEVRHDLMMSDSLQLAGTLTRDLVVPLMVLNIGAIEDMRRIPRLIIDLRESEELSLYAEALPKLVDVGLPVPVSWAQDKLRIPAPEKDEPVLVRSQPLMIGDQPPAAATAIVAAATQNGLDEFNLFSDELTADWERVTDPLSAPVLALAAGSTSFEDFQQGLPKLIESMDTTKTNRNADTRAIHCRYLRAHA